MELYMVFQCLADKKWYRFSYSNTGVQKNVSVVSKGKMATVILVALVAHHTRTLIACNGSSLTI
jgi:hypothetical protein